MIPCVHDAASDMLAFRSRLFNTRRLSDVDRKLAFGPENHHISIQDREKALERHIEVGGSWKGTNLVWSTLRVVGA